MFCSSNYNFGDFCPNIFKYLMVEYCCIDSFTTSSTTSTTTTATRSGYTIACEGSNLELSCPSNQAIKISYANYGRLDNSICCYDPSLCLNINCVSSNATLIASSYCSSKSSCSLPAYNSFFSDPCGGTYKYLKVDYDCVDKFTTTTSTSTTTTTSTSTTTT